MLPFPKNDLENKILQMHQQHKLWKLKKLFKEKIKIQKGKTRKGYKRMSGP